MRSAKQTRFINAIEHSPSFAAKVKQSPAPDSGAISAPAMAITTPGGAVQSGGYFGNTKFLKPSMPNVRKSRL